MNKTFDHACGAYLDCDDAKIYYEIAGKEDGPVLLLLHGGFGNLDDFHTILPELTEHFKVIGIDSPGHGKSTFHSTPLTYEQIQKDIELVLAHLSINKFSVIGFSDGGIVAYRLASFTSLQIEKLVTIGAYWHVDDLDPVRNIFLNITSENWREKFPHTYEAYQKLNPVPDFEFFTKATIKMWLDTTQSGMPGHAVKNISCPVLIVRGDDDPFLPKESVVGLSKVLKKAHLFNIPFAGHVSFDDQKDAFMISLNEFLKR